LICVLIAGRSVISSQVLALFPVAARDCYLFYN